MNHQYFDITRQNGEGYALVWKFKSNDNLTSNQKNIKHDKGMEGLKSSILINALRNKYASHLLQELIKEKDRRKSNT